MALTRVLPSLTLGKFMELPMGEGDKLKGKEKEEEINRLEGRQAQMLPPAAAAS